MIPTLLPEVMPSDLRTAADVPAAARRGPGRRPRRQRMMMIVGRDEDVRHVLTHPEVFSSGEDAVAIGQVRPLIPLQIDPPQHKSYRKLLDPIFAPKQVAKLGGPDPHPGPGLVEPLVGRAAAATSTSVAEPLPTTVFLQLLGLPVSRPASSST